MTDTTISDATRATMSAWAAIADASAERVRGAKFGIVLATFDGQTVAASADIVRTGLLPKSTATRYADVARHVANALGADNIPTPSAKAADALAVFVALGGALANVNATHRAGILDRLSAHADSLSDLVSRAQSLLAEAKEAREPQGRGARPEGNTPAVEAQDSADSAPVADDVAEGPRPLSSILGELKAHLDALPAEDLADALDEVSALVDQASARIFA